MILIPYDYFSGTHLMHLQKLLSKRTLKAELPNARSSFINSNSTYMDTAELRTLFPEITDEEIANRQEASKESRRQSLRDQLANKREEITSLEHQLAELEPVAEPETPAEEAQEATEEPQG